MGHMTLGDEIRLHRFLKGFSEQEIAALAELSTLVEFDEEALILKGGQLSEYLYLVVSGSVAVELRTPRLTISVQALGAGEAFGWSALLDHHETSFQVRARETVRAVRIQGRGLTQLCRKDGQLGTELLLRVLKLVAGRVKATERSFAEMCGVRLESPAD